LAAALFGEDGAMLLIAIPLAHWVRAVWLGDRPAPPRVVILVAIGLGLVWFAVRTTALGTPVGGYGDLPTVAAMLKNLLRGPSAVLLVPPDSSGFRYLAAVLNVAAVAGAVLACWRQSRVAGAAIVGFALVGSCNLPLAVVSSIGRWHLLVLGMT